MKQVPLEEWIAQFEDEDPWTVSSATWNRRMNSGGGIPEHSIVLTDPDTRAWYREEQGPAGDAVRRIDTTIAERRGSREGKPEPRPDNLAIRVGHAIRFRRITLGLGLRALSRMTQLTPTLISRIETAKRLIRLDELEIIAGARGDTPQGMLERAKQVRLND